MLSLRRAGLSHGALQMAVLCQEVVPAQYAFVAHTTNPTTGVGAHTYVLICLLHLCRQRLLVKVCSHPCRLASQRNVSALQILLQGQTTPASRVQSPLQYSQQRLVICRR